MWQCAKCGKTARVLAMGAVTCHCGHVDRRPTVAAPWWFQWGGMVAWILRRFGVRGKGCGGCGRRKAKLDILGVRCWKLLTRIR